MLDALSFVLFGKAHRNINKPQLVNSINKKNCLVEVEFEIGKNTYFIRRGIAPGVFEIHVNGSMLDQSSKSKDYQKILEQNILKLNHKSFHQVVVLGSSSFIPFMQLSAWHRRTVIEDLLDINVFSKMNIILKEQNNVLKEKIKEIDHLIELNDTKHMSQKRHITNLEKLNKEHKEDIKKQIDTLQEEVERFQAENQELTDELNGFPDIDEDLRKTHDYKQTLLHANGQLTSEIKIVVKDAKFYETHNNCPTCKQEIDEETKDTSLQSLKEKARILSNRKSQFEKEYATVDIKIAELSDLKRKIIDCTNAIKSNISNITRNQRSISDLEEKIDSMNSSESDISTSKAELEVLESEKYELVNNKLKLTDEFQYNTVMLEMLKDSGIKSKVIKQYVPVINKLVNNYLQVLDFFVSFNLDESFNEEIRSRYRDTFSYASFSEGEKQRIDLALLFTWRMIAKMKNSVATNLLILDETFDSSLDHDGVENLMKILYTLPEDSNVFVISHKGEILEGKFEKKIEFAKEKNFSVMKG